MYYFLLTYPQESVPAKCCNKRNMAETMIKSGKSMGENFPTQALILWPFMDIRADQMPGQIVPMFQFLNRQGHPHN